MTTLQQQARALGDPTRHAVFRYVAEAGRQVDVAELTAHFELNHNAIRQHLSKLVDAGLVVSGTRPASGRGRPRLCYELAPTADGRWGVEGPYERLSALLSEMVRTGDQPVEVGRRAGSRGAARDAGHDESVDAVSALVREMSRHGFDPIVERRGDEIEMTLQNCPFASTALADPATVCATHLGIAQGVAEAVGGLVVDELVPHDPRIAGCRLRCHVDPSYPGRPVPVDQRSG